MTAMAQSGLWAGMQSVGTASSSGWLQIELGRVGLNPAAISLRQVRCAVEDDGKTKKKAPVRLPGGRQVPTYGGTGGSFSNSPPGLGQFRPPSLFGMSQIEEVSEEEVARIEDILEQIRGGSGSWQERAAGVVELQKSGMGAEEIYDKAYVPTSTQTVVVVAAQVYQSLVQVECSPDVLNWYDDSKVDVLYSLRTLSAQQRKLAAEYVKDNDLDTPGSAELAKAIKDHERRPEGRQGFTPVPGDCLAFSLHRAAGETTNAEERVAFIERGLSVAVTDSAKQRFAEFS